MKYSLPSLFLLFAIIGHAQNPSTSPISGATPKSFASFPDQRGIIESSVNLFTGDLQFPINLVSLPGRNGLDVGVSISYNSNVHPYVNTWNAEAATGVVGLGWSFDYPKIVVDNKMTGTREDDIFYLVEGGDANRLIYAGSSVPTEKIYKTKLYNFWIIKYYPADEKWEITKDDGTRFIYGDINSTRNTVQWIVHWNNWVGSSNVVTSTVQKQQALVWNLSEIRSLWNDVVEYSYQNINQNVGTSAGKLQTEASYLSSIKDVTGKKVLFNYGDKLAGEYFEPHTENGTNAIDAYQERYEKKYLDYLLVQDESNVTLFKVDLEYSTIGSGDLTKRLLTSITQFNAQNQSFPGYQFSYLTAAAPDTNYGALQTITTPTKGTINFAYTKQTLVRAMREKKVDAMGGYKEAKVWIGPNYVVIARREQLNSAHTAAGRNVKLQVFTWEGEWIEWNLNETLPGLALVKLDGTAASLIDQEFQYHNLILTMQENFFSIYYRSEGVGYNTLKIYRRDENSRGKWTKYEENITTSSTPLKKYFDLVSGENFVCTTGTFADLRVYTWNGSAWGPTYIGRPDKEHDHLVAGHNYIVSFTRSPDLLTLYFLKEDGSWITKTAPNFATTTTSIDCYWYPAASFLVAMVKGNPEYFVWWNESYDVQIQSSGLSLPDNSYVDIIDNSMVGILTTDPTPVGYAARFNGQSWYVSPSMDFGGITSYRLSQSYGIDFAIRPKTSTNVLGLKRFNPNSNSWTDFTFNTSNKNMLIAGHNYFVMVDPTVSTKVNLYMRKPDGSFVKDPNSYSGTGYNGTEYRYPWQAGYNFVIKSIHDTSTPQGLTAIGFKNGRLDPDPLKMDFARLGNFNTGYPAMDAIGYYDPTYQMASGNTIVGFLGSFAQENATELKLFKLIDGQAAGALTDYPVHEIRTDAGNRESYSYLVVDDTKATYDASGNIAQYNMVTVFPGEDWLTMEKGKTEYFFFNGIDAATATNFPPTISGVDFDNNLKLLNGQVYRTKVWKKASPNVVISEIINSPKVYSNNVQVASVTKDKSYYVRPYATEASQDNLKIYSVTETNETNGLPLRKTIYNRVGAVDSDPIIHDIKYGFETYSYMATKNILSPIAQIKKTANGQVLECKAIRFSNWASTTPDVYDEFVWQYTGSPDFTSWTTTLSPSSDWQLLNRITVRDQSTGVPLEKLGTADQKSAVIWDQYKKRPLAQVANSLASDVAYTSFEDLSSGGLLYTGNNTVSTGDAKTGNSFLILGTNGITKSDLNATKQYVVSFWAKSNVNSSVNLAGVGAITVNTSGVWKYHQYSIIGSTGLNLAKTGSNDVFIDEIRIYPVGAKMETYTYHPLFGKTSETAPDNRTLYTDYDDFGRVRMILDQNKNIVRSYKYKIKQ